MILLPNQYYLSETITGAHGNKQADKGDVVTLISELQDHLTVVTVQDQKGKRFPVNVKYLTKKKVEAQVKAPEPNPEPVKAKGRKKVEQPKLL